MHNCALIIHPLHLELETALIYFFTNYLLLRFTLNE